MLLWYLTGTIHTVFSSAAIITQQVSKQLHNADLKKLEMRGKA